MGVTATFNGPYTKGYMQYIDLSTYHTLVAVPGNTYDIGIASGWEVLATIPADGLWSGAVPPSLALFSAVPALGAPGAFFPGSPGTATQNEDAMDAALELPYEDEEWAERVVASSAADTAVFGEIHERLAGAAEKIAVLRRRQGGAG